MYVVHRHFLDRRPVLKNLKLNPICITKLAVYYFINSGTDEMCLTMDGSPSSYQLLGNFAAGQQLYRLELEAEEDGASSSILFSAPNGNGGGGGGGYSQGRQGAPLHPQRVKLPTLRATEQHLAALQCTYEYT